MPPGGVVSTWRMASGDGYLVQGLLLDALDKFIESLELKVVRWERAPVVAEGALLSWRKWKR